MLAALFCLAPLAISPGVVAPGVQESIPANAGWVTDLGDLLTPGEERALEDLMESFKRGSSHEIALLTVPSLEGRAIEPFALEVARAWGLGGADASNGALLVVSKGDRAMRIETGRGLEGTLTDSIAGRIIRDVIAPPFKRGHFFDGLLAGVRATHAAVGGDYGALERSGKQRKRRGGLACFPILFVLMMVTSIFGRRRGGGRGGGLGGILPWLVLSQMGGRGGGGGWSSGGGGGGGFSGFGGGGGFSGGGASGGW